MTAQAIAPVNGSAMHELPVRGRILLAEDDESNQLYAISLLERDGWEVDLARTVREAIALGAARLYDAILLDCQMPDLGVHEAVRELRRPGGASRRTPIIALTAHDTTPDRESLPAAGIAAYVVKPFEVATLRDALDRACAPRLPSVGDRADAATSAPNRGADVGGAGMSASVRSDTTPHAEASAPQHGLDTAMGPVTGKPDRPAKSLPTLMLADDDAVVLMLLVEELRGTFDCVGVASDAEAAVTLVARHKPDVAVLDVNMPAGGAAAATPRIRRLSPDTAIVILSIDETHEQVVELVELGATTYLRKGVDSATLIAKLLASIRAHRSLAADHATMSTA